MSRRDQPYIPLYVMDFLTDEKLRECSAESVGVYIMLMCVMHKQEEYGTIVLREKDRKSADAISNFAEKLSRHLPFGEEVIRRAIQELIDEGVIYMNGNRLFQKRMVHDADVSEKRAIAGKKGSAATNAKLDATKQVARHPQTSDIEAGESPEGGQNSKRGVYDDIAALYNEICVSFPRLIKLSDARKKAIKARLASGYTVDDFKELFQKAEASGFLKGKNKRNWQATFDWLVKDSNMAKVIDGNYSEGGSNYGAGNDRNGAGEQSETPETFKPSGGFRGQQQFNHGSAGKGTGDHD